MLNYTRTGMKISGMEGDKSVVCKSVWNTHWLSTIKSWHCRFSVKYVVFVTLKKQLLGIKSLIKHSFDSGNHLQWQNLVTQFYRLCFWCHLNLWAVILNCNLIWWEYVLLKHTTSFYVVAVLLFTFKQGHGK